MLHSADGGLQLWATNASALTLLRRSSSCAQRRNKPAAASSAQPSPILHAATQRSAVDWSVGRNASAQRRWWSLFRSHGLPLCRAREVIGILEHRSIEAPPSREKRRRPARQKRRFLAVADGHIALYVSALTPRFVYIPPLPHAFGG